MKQTRDKLPWAVTLLVVFLCCAIAWICAGMLTNRSGGGKMYNVSALRIDGIKTSEVTRKGLVAYDGSTIKLVGPDAEPRWSYTVGLDCGIRSSDSGIAAWNGKTLTLIDIDTGVADFSGQMESPVISAELGEVYAAVLTGEEGNGTMIIMEPGGNRVDNIVLAEQTVIDYGFFHNDTLFWVMTLDTSGTAPACTLSTYRPGRRQVGKISDQVQVLYKSVFQSSRISVIGDTFMREYDYSCTENEQNCKLVYGWTLAATDEESTTPMMAFVPSGQFDSGAEIRDVRMIRGSRERIVRMPFACESIIARDDRVYGFSKEGYLMLARMDEQKVNAYRISIQFDNVLGVSDNGVSILNAGDIFYFVSLSDE